MTRSNYRFPSFSDSISGTTKVIQLVESRDCALKAGELAKLLGVTRQHIYKMAANGAIPSFRIGASVRFDPRQVSEWLKMRMPSVVSVRVNGIVV